MGQTDRRTDSANAKYSRAQRGPHSNSNNNNNNTKLEWHSVEGIPQPTR